jgi:non-specific serine/threonine protein kinase/serine/threonine-protein kinase
MSSQRELIEQLFEAALGLGPIERAVFLDKKCADNPELRRAVEDLLAADAAVGSFLDRPLLGTPTADYAKTEGIIIGPYHLLQLIGQGGMGEVWLAEQTQPVRRRVAVKLIKTGMDTKEVVARFESERQALALMDHPAIAKVFDAGSTVEGRPYFVMEYVAGMPITEYCDRHKLNTRQRLELFISVCEGVQHAHQKAIIHRDLKPSNILVTEVDGKPVPRIIDFGVAKATSQRLNAHVLRTQIGAFIGTLGYISPEQADSGGEDIDTRSDVYSLGVVLYELLSGTLPFDFGKLAYDEALRCLREQDAPSPSQQLRTTVGDSALAAKNRSASLATLVSQLRGDPDAITLKALEKDRGRRYSTPADIRRYVQNEAVLAHAPSAAYRARKYVRRHRLGVTLVSLLVLLAVVFAAAQATELRRIRRERDRADRITDFLTNMFKVSSPSEARGNTVTAREILDRSSDEIERGLDRDPAVRSQLMLVMAMTYENLGLFSRAHALLERVLQDRVRTLGADNPKTLEAMSQMGWVLHREGHDVQAERLIRTTIDAQSRVLSPDDPSTLDSRDRLARILLRQAHYAQVEKLERELIAVSSRRQGPENPQALRFMDGLARALAGQNRFAEAEAEYRQLLDVQRGSLGADHPDTLATVHALATVFLNQGSYEEAERLYRENLEIQKRILGPEHPDTANTMTTLANSIRFIDGRNAEAESLYRKSLDIELRAVGPDHPYTTGAQEGLANVLSAEQRYAEGETLLRQVLTARQHLLGNEHTDTLLAEYNLATVLKRENRLEEAETLTRGTLETQARLLDADDPDTLASRSLLADILLREQRPQEAEEFARRAFNDQLRTLGPQHHDTLESLGFLGEALTRTGRYEDVKKIYADTIARIGADTRYTAREGVVDLWYDLACLAVRTGHRDEAFDYLDHAVDAGYSNAPFIRADETLKSLRNDPRFDKLLARATAASRPPAPVS